MNVAVIDLLLIGLVAVAVALMFVLALVYFELGPTAQLTGRKRWLLAAALGSGVLAFTLKLLIIVTIAEFPNFLMAPSVDKIESTRPTASPPPRTTPPRYVWTPLSIPDANAHKPAVSAPKPYIWQSLPDQVPSPHHNPTTVPKVELGKQLFFDRDLSRDGTVACASCHDIYGKAGTDGQRISHGIDSQAGTRNAPTVWNAAFQSMLFWDGRAASLEEQAKGPILNPLEMGMPSPSAVEERVRNNPQYRRAFAQAFGGDTPITFTQIVQVIAAYERTLITYDSPYDKFVRGDLTALKPKQLRGMALFQSVGCINCHYGPNFSAASLFDNRAPQRIFPAKPTPYEQRYDLVRDTGAAAASSGRGLWRVPSLRNVALTGPWLHNGAVSDLKEVVRIMASAQLGRAGRYLQWSDQTKVLDVVDRPVLNDGEISDIVAFLHALSSEALVKNRGDATRH